MIDITNIYDTDTINPVVKKSILKTLTKYLDIGQSCRISKLLLQTSLKHATLNECLSIIREEIEDGCLEIIEKDKNFINFKIRLKKSPKLNEVNKNKFKIVVSLPKMNEIGLNNIIKRNNFLELKEAFKKVIRSTKKELRIISPYIQGDILSKDTFPELKNILTELLRNDVSIKLMTREINKKNAKEIKWLLDIANEVDPELLEIVDYYISKKNRLYSSTHAKIIISDKKIAYLGSGELRKNSLKSNLEIGSLIEGDVVTGLCEIFDYIYLRGENYF